MKKLKYRNSSQIMTLIDWWPLTTSLFLDKRTDSRNWSLIRIIVSIRTFRPFYSGLLLHGRWCDMWWRHKPFPSNLDRIFLQELLSRQLSLKNNCEDRDMIDFQNWFEPLISTSGWVSGFGPGPKINNRLSVTKGHNSIPKEVWQVQKVHLNWNTLSTSTPGIHEPKPGCHGPRPEFRDRTSENEPRLGQEPDLSWNRTSPDLSQCRSVDPCMNHESCSKRLFYELLFYLQINKKKAKGWDIQ